VKKIYGAKKEEIPNDGENSVRGLDIPISKWWKGEKTIKDISSRRELLEES